MKLKSIEYSNNQPIQIKRFLAASEAKKRWPKQIQNVPGCTHTMEFQERNFTLSCGASPDPHQMMVVAVMISGAPPELKNPRNQFIITFHKSKGGFQGSIRIFRRMTLKDSAIWQPDWKKTQKSDDTGDSPYRWKNARLRASTPRGLMIREGKGTRTVNNWGFDSVYPNTQVHWLLEEITDKELLQKFNDAHKAMIK